MESKKLILHGGFAINAVLPPELQFYDEHTVPDYDALVSDDFGRETKKIMYQAQRALAEKGYWAHFRPAVHESTQKLRAHPQGLSRLAILRYPSIFDATAVPVEDFKILKNLSDSKKHLRPKSLAKIPLIPTAYMKMSIHLEFSRPSVHIQRWRKLFPRASRLYAAHPFVVLGKQSQFKPKIYDRAGLKAVLKHSEPSQLILVGEHIAMRIIGMPQSASAGTLDVVTRNFESLHDTLEGGTPKPSKIVPESFFLPRHFQVGDCTVFAWEECTTYVREEGSDDRLGNSDTLLRYMYGQYLLYNQTSIIDDLTAFQNSQTAVDIAEAGISSRFSTTCM